MSRRDLADLVLTVFIAAAITLLVRPSSKGPALVSAFGESMGAIASYAIYG